MLEEKLRQASAADARTRTRLLWMLGFGLLAAIAVMVVLSYVQHAPSHSAAEVISKPVSQPIHQPVEQSIDPTAPQSTDQQGLREQFMTRLQAYQSGLETRLADANIKQWNADQAAELQARKQAAISAFGTGDYVAALKHLDELETMAKQVLTKRDALFAGEIAAVKQALGKDDVVSAKLHITKALQVKPDDPEAQTLEKQVQTLPGLLDLISKADIARTENSPEQEFAWLNRAIDIAPQRAGLKQRRDALAERIRQAQFAQLIANGLSSVDNNALADARRNYKKAKAMYPDRAELGVLQTAIHKRSEALALKHALAGAKQAIAADDWNTAQSIYAGAAKRFADNSNIHDGLQLAGKVVSLQQAVAGYLARPERLASPNVSAAARDTLIQARIFAQNSPSLAHNASRLQHLLVSMNRRVPVLVQSDNHTFIRVRGVGKVGLTLARTIRLKPGTYLFEGIRDGYKSKLVKVRVREDTPVGKQALTVKVVCDERI